MAIGDAFSAPMGVKNQMYGQPQRVPGYAEGYAQAPGQARPALPPEPYPIGRPTGIVGGPAYYTPPGFQAPPQPTQAFMPTDVRPDPIGQQFMRQLQSPMGQQFQAQYEATQAPMRAREAELRDAERARQDQRFQELMNRIAELEGQLSAREEAATIPPPQIPYVPGGPFIPGLPDFSDFDFSQIDFSNLPETLDLGDVELNIPGIQKGLRTFLNIPEPTAPINREEIIRDVQSQLKIPERFDPTEIQKQIEELKARPVFEPQELDREALVRDIQSQIKLPEIPQQQIDREDIIRDIQSRINIPKMPALPDVSKFATREDISKAISRLPQAPQIDVESLRKDILSQVPQAPQIDRESLIRDIQAGIKMPAVPEIDRQALIRDIQSQIKVPERFDPSSLESRISGLQSQIQGIPQFDPTGLQQRLGALESREIPTFDPSGLQQQISGLQKQLAGLPRPQQIDVEALRRDILSQVPKQPSIDVEALKRDILSSIPQQQSLPSIPRINLPSIIR